MTADDLYYGPPDAERFCVFTKKKPVPVPQPDGAASVTVLHGYRCPNHISFYIKVPDGRSDDWRKAWASCADHLATVIWEMQETYGGDSLYGGEYQLRAEELLWNPSTW